MRQKLMRQLFRPRFSLKVLLVLMLVLGAGFGWFGYRLERATTQKHLVAEIERRGGIVRYEWERIGDSGLPKRDWLRRWLGHDFFDEVISVDVVPRGHLIKFRRETSSEPVYFSWREGVHPDSTAIRKLAASRWAWGRTAKASVLSRGGSFAQTTGIKPSVGYASFGRFSRFTELETLNLSSTPIEDLSVLRLHRMKKLEYLDISYTGVDNLDELNRCTSLVTLDLVGLKVQDYSPLEHLHNLKHLYVSSYVDRIAMTAMLKPVTTDLEIFFVHDVK